MSFAVKLFGAVLLLASGASCGFFFSGRLYRRREFLSGFFELLTCLKIEMRFTRDEIVPLIRRSAPESLKEVFSSDNNSYREYWAECLNRIRRSFVLKPGDIELLNGFAQSLGTTDIDGQTEHIELYLGLISKALGESESECHSKGRLYKLLGFFAGAVLAVLII